MQIKVILITIYIFGAISHVLAQAAAETVATVGDIKISREEFQVRYELTPQIMKENKSLKESLKTDFLYSLIAEKLLALYGQTIMLDTAEVVQFSLKAFEEIFVRDELYRKVIIENARPKVDSIIDFYLLNAATLKTIYIKSNDKNEINNIYNLIVNKVPFDTLCKELSSNISDTMTVSISQLDDKAEHELFKLKENEVSRPVTIDNKYYIFKIIKRTNPLSKKPAGWEKEYEKIEKYAKSKVEDEYYKEYINNLFKPLSVKADGKLLQKLAKEVYKILRKKITNTQIPQKFYLDNNDVSMLISNISKDTLNMTYVLFPNDKAQLKEFIYYLRFENTLFDSIELNDLINVLNIKTKKFIEHKILAKEGFKLGLNNSENVKKKCRIWKQNYFFQLALNTIIDSTDITEDELKKYYNESFGGKLKIKMVNIVEVLISDLETAEIVLNELQDGKDIRDLAMIYSIDKNVVNKQGESGFFSITSRGEIGAIADRLNIGQIYGPLKIEEGYLIFKLIDIKTDSITNSGSFDQMRAELRNELRYLKRKESINKFIAHLADKFNVSINHDLLKSIRVTNINSIMYNYLGFGGKMTAVPLLAPNVDWAEQWIKNQQQPQVIP